MEIEKKSFDDTKKSNQNLSNEKVSQCFRKQSKSIGGIKMVSAHGTRETMLVEDVKTSEINCTD